MDFLVTQESLSDVMDPFITVGWVYVRNVTGDDALQSAHFQLSVTPSWGLTERQTGWPNHSRCRLVVQDGFSCRGSLSGGFISHFWDQLLEIQLIAWAQCDDTVWSWWGKVSTPWRAPPSAYDPSHSDLHKLRLDSNVVPPPPKACAYWSVTTALQS